MSLSNVESALQQIGRGTYTLAALGIDQRIQWQRHPLKGLERMSNENPITEAELRKIDCDEEFVFASASPEERLDRLRLLQRTIAENHFRITSIQRLYLRAYELASAEEREELRKHNEEFKTLPSVTDIGAKLTEEEKILAQMIKAGLPEPVARELLKKQGITLP